MTPRPARTAAAFLVAAALVLAGCSGDDGAIDGSTRPPLGSPPDPGPVPDDDRLDAAVRAEVTASTVGISGVACGRLSTGSGFAIAEDVIATNAHVILGVEAIEVRTVDDRVLAARAVAYDPVADLAILSVDALGLAPLPLGGAEDQTVGALLGWEDAPDPSPYRIDRPVTVRIEVVGGEERIERPSWLVAAEIDKGDSGGALVDPDGVVVGVAYATSRKGEGVGYAVRSSELEALLAQGFDDNLIVPNC